MKSMLISLFDSPSNDRRISTKSKYQNFNILPFLLVRTSLKF